MTISKRAPIWRREQIDMFKALNILYDRDSEGEFRQAYTATLDGGLFFEFVQRDGYVGYGAPNAGIRLTAQARLHRPAAALSDGAGLG